MPSSLWNSFVGAMESAAENQNIDDLKVAADIATDFTASDWDNKRFDKSYVVYAVKYLIKHKILPTVKVVKCYSHKKKPNVLPFDPEPINNKFKEKIDQYKDMRVFAKKLQEEITKAKKEYLKNSRTKTVTLSKVFTIYDKDCFGHRVYLNLHECKSWKEIILSIVEILAGYRDNYSIES